MASNDKGSNAVGLRPKLAASPSEPALQFSHSSQKGQLAASEVSTESRPHVRVTPVAFRLDYCPPLPAVTHSLTSAQRAGTYIAQAPATILAGAVSCLFQNAIFRRSLAHHSGEPRRRRGGPLRDVRPQAPTGSLHGQAARDWVRVAWRGVAWRGVAWRGVAWRGVVHSVAWKVRTNDGSPGGELMIPRYQRV